MNLLDFFGDSIVAAIRTRYAIGAVDDEGDWSPGASSDTPIQIVAPQPVAADEIQFDTDGESIRDYRQTFIDASIDIRVSAPGIAADHITVNSTEYKVHQIDDWEFEGGFNHVILRKV